MSCNVCIAPEEEGDSFRSIDSDDAIAEKIETVFKLKLSETAKICQRCEKEVETAYDVYNRIFDAKDYFEHLKSETDVAKVFFECFHCSEVFTELDKFEAHIESLPLMLSIEADNPTGVEPDSVSDDRLDPDHSKQLEKNDKSL